MGKGKPSKLKCIQQNFCKSLVDINCFLTNLCKTNKGVRMYKLLKKK